MTEHDQAALRAYIEGRNAFRDGLRPSDNPYREYDFHLSDNWERGYEDAFTKHAESFGA
jgi:hypothetical protein